MRWFLEPHSKLHSSSGFCNTQTEMSITLCAGFLRVICPGQPDTLIWCRSCLTTHLGAMPCQRRPGFRHNTLPWILSHWNIECQVNLRPGTVAGRAEHSDNPMMSGGEQLLQPVLTCQTHLSSTLSICFRQSQELLKSKDFVWAVQLSPTKYVLLNLLCRANPGWQFCIAAATVLLLPFLAPDLLLWTCIGCLCGQPFDHFHLLAFLPCCDRMSARIFSNQRACRDRDKKNRGQLLQVRPQPLYSGGFVYLGIHHSSLATHTGATIEVEVARCTNCSSKLCVLFDPVQPRSLQQTRLHENYKFDHFHLLAYLPCCDHMSAHIFSNQRACRDCDKKNRIPWVQGRGTQPDSSAWKVHSSFLTEIQLCVAFERVAFLIVDFSFHGQGQLLQVRPQPLYSGGFVYLGIHHSSLANCTGASIANVVARYQNSSSKLCLSLGSFEPRSLQQTRLHKNYNFGTITSYHCVKWS